MVLAALETRKSTSNLIVSTTNVYDHDMNVKLCSTKYNILTKTMISRNLEEPLYQMSQTAYLSQCMKKQFLLLSAMGLGIACHCYGK